MNGHVQVDCEELCLWAEWECNEWLVCVVIVDLKVAAGEVWEASLGLEECPAAWEVCLDQAAYTLVIER